MINQFDEEVESEDIDLPDTVFIRDIESRVFQAITIKCLSNIEGISLLEGTIIDNLLGREGLERIKGIYVEQDSKNQTVNIKIELNVAYGVSLPEKAEEIQNKLVEQITKLTGLHVSSVHIVFKNLFSEEILKDIPIKSKEKDGSDSLIEEYGEDL